MPIEPQGDPETQWDSLADLIGRLDDRLAELNGSWRLEKELFQVPEHYVYFADSAPMIWHILRDALVDSVFMSIARLLDPPVSCGKETLSFAQIIRAIPAGPNRDAVQGEYDGLIPIYDAALRHWRNRKISHNDLLIVNGVEKLPELSFAEISNLISKLNSLGRKIGQDIQHIDKSFVPAISNDSWVWRLIETLKRGTKKG